MIKFKMVQYNLENLGRARSKNSRVVSCAPLIYTKIFELNQNNWYLYITNYSNTTN